MSTTTAAAPIKVLFFGTHPKQFNGYSKVVYELSKVMVTKKDFDFSIYGFQNFYNEGHHRPDLPDNLYIYDAFNNENPKQMGFGVEQVKDVLAERKPDVCIIFNDLLVITQLLQKMSEIENRKFKIVVYIDQVYLHQRKDYVEFVNKNADYAIMFTPYWRECILKQGLKLPSYYLQHGFNKLNYYPVPKNLARILFGFGMEDFLIVNLNRNQPRKRWDTCIMAFVEFVLRHKDAPIKLVIATEVTGAWNLIEIFEAELIRHGMTLADGMKYLHIMDRPQKLNDIEVNALYNACDVGINTADGEGWGLCSFEQGGIGVPQIVPRVGGFIEFCTDDTVVFIEPSAHYYIDNGRDPLCGLAQMCDHVDFANAMDKLYLDRKLGERLGKNCRKKVLTEYPWTKIGDHLEYVIKDIWNNDAKGGMTICSSSAVESVAAPAAAVATKAPAPAAPSKKPVKVDDDTEELDFDFKMKLGVPAQAPVPRATAPATAPVAEPASAPTPSTTPATAPSPACNTRHELVQKLKAKTKNMQDTRLKTSVKQASAAVAPAVPVVPMANILPVGC